MQHMQGETGNNRQQTGNTVITQTVFYTQVKHFTIKTMIIPHLNCNKLTVDHGSSRTAVASESLDDHGGASVGLAHPAHVLRDDEAQKTQVAHSIQGLAGEGVGLVAFDLGRFSVFAFCFLNEGGCTQENAHAYTLFRFRCT